MTGEEARGRFVWYDLVAKDVDAALSFYPELIGWKTELWEDTPTDQPYTMWVNGESPLGGVMDMTGKAPEDAPAHWLAYLATPDVDAVASGTEELGGAVLHGPDDIPTVGRFAVIKDPQGSVICAFTPAGEAPGSSEPAKLGEFSWHELATTDHAAAFDFYSALFGWTKMEAMDMGEMGIYQIYGRQQDGYPLGGIFNKPAEMPGPPAWLYYIRVADVNASVEQVKRLGGKILNGPMEVPGGDLVAQCLDSQGAAFALHSRAD